MKRRALARRNPCARGAAASPCKLIRNRPKGAVIEARAPTFRCHIIADAQCMALLAVAPSEVGTGRAHITSKTPACYATAPVFVVSSRPLDKKKQQKLVHVRGRFFPMKGRRRREVVRTVMAALVIVGMCRSERGLNQKAGWPPGPASGRVTLRPPLPGSLCSAKRTGRAH